MQDELPGCLKQAFFKRRKKLIPLASKGRFLYDLKSYADAHMALILWWRCNYINYGMSPIVKKRLYLPLLNPVLQAAAPFYTFSKSSGLPCIPKQKNRIANQLDNSTQTILNSLYCTPEPCGFVSHLSLNNIHSSA